MHSTASVIAGSGTHPGATSASVLLQRGIELHRAGEVREAGRIYRKALEVDPQNADAFHLLGLIEFQRGRDEAAAARFREAIAARPDCAHFHHSLGLALQRLGQRDEAVMAYLRAAERDRGHFDALFQLGALLCELLRPDEGTRALRLAAALRPDHADTRLYLALCLERLGQLDAAVEQYLASLRRQPNDPRTYLLLGGALFKAGHIVECDLAFQRSLALNPDQPAARSRRIAALNYRSDLDAATVAAAHREWGRIHADPLTAPVAVTEKPGPRPLPDRRLRIGYVSPNFHRHSVSHFLLPLLRNHDRSRFEIFGYSAGPAVDETTHAVRAETDHWRSIVGQSDDTVAETIRRDRIDILVDLAGHFGDNRLMVFARRPAPVQVSWLGYPQTTGLTAMDYRVSDEITDPLGQVEAWSSETIVRLPHGFHLFGRPGEEGAGDGCGDPGPVAVSPLPALANGYVTFGSFNTVQKMPPSLVTLWARVLAAVPDSRLLLKSLPDDVIAERFRALFAAEGIDPARIEFLHITSGRREHLLLYSRMDIALDPFPYHGTTTTCEALWMGVPVVTLLGDRHVSRVGASLLTQVGLMDWIAPDAAGYVARAAAGAADLGALAKLRAGLRERMRHSPLCDGPGFARRIEAAFRTMRQAGPRDANGTGKEIATFS